MGNAISSGVNYCTSFLVGKAKYILELEDNLDALQSAAQRLEARRVDLENRIEKEERKGLQRLQEVGVWLSGVKAIQPQVRDLLDARTVEIERLSTCGYCSKNFILTYSYGKKVSENLEKVQGFLSSEAPRVVATTGLRPDMEEGSTQYTIGLENMLEATWNRLMQDRVGILGLYGMGGIGKTTLLEQIEKKFLEKRDEFDVVIFVVVSQDLQIERIQKEIGKRLGLWDEQWEQKTKKEKASNIEKVLTRKRFVMLLDDIWSKVELNEIGIPLHSPENRSKVVYTSRSRKVCGRMGPHDMEVKCLGPENAWKLFRQKVRASTLESDPKILKLARIVCGKCNGLPLALNVIGETMACKTTVHEWQHAIDVLNSNAAGYPEVEEEILKILKLSYDYLEDVKVQQCLQYCALFPEDSRIEKDRLVDYWICEGIINGGGPREKAVDKGYNIIGILVSACLLINNESGETVTMHDVIRQMALWIASNFGEEEENFVVKSGAGLHQMPEVKNWNAVRRMSLQNNQIETISIIPDCPNLTTLFLRENKLVNISGECFQSMSKLVVLDLSWNKHLNKLPEEVSKLVSLQYLGLAGTGLEELPMGLRELIQLRHLNLNRTTKLQSISVISRLLNLETLEVFDSIPLSLASIEDIELLKNLKFLSVTIAELSILECFLSIPRLASCTQHLCLHLGKFGGENVSLAATAASLRGLWIQGGSISYLMEDTRYECRSPSTVSFQNLKNVALKDVSGIQDLTWLLFAPSLTTLFTDGLPEVREIISREKVSRIINEGSSIIPFQKLGMLHLSTMKELTSIYWEPLVFPDLTVIFIRACPKLKKLPLNKESSKGNYLHLQIDDDKEWWDGIEWEDEEIKDRLLHKYQVKRKSINMVFKVNLTSLTSRLF